MRDKPRRAVGLTRCRGRSRSPQIPFPVDCKPLTPAPTPPSLAHARYSQAGNSRMPPSSETLSPVQQQVLSLLASGSTAQAAAESAGVHRNTVSNWRRSSAAFRASWQASQHEQAMHWRDELQPLAALAIFTLKDLMIEPRIPASVRLRAALAVFRAISAPPPEPPALQNEAPDEAQVEPVHNSAQSCTTDQPLSNALARGAEAGSPPPAVAKLS